MSSIAHIALWGDWYALKDHNLLPGSETDDDERRNPGEDPEDVESEYDPLDKRTRRIMDHAARVLTDEGPMKKAALARKVGVSASRFEKLLKTTSCHILFWEDHGMIGVLEI